MHKIKVKYECVKHVIKNAGNILLNMIRLIYNFVKVVTWIIKYHKIYNKFINKINHQVLHNKIKLHKFKLLSNSTNQKNYKILNNCNKT